MRFSTEDSQEKQPIMPGTYLFIVSGAEEKMSKTGNAMIELKLFVQVDQSTNFQCYSHLVASPNAVWKIRQFCQSVGLPFSGELNAIDCEGKQGHAAFVKGSPNQKGDVFLEVGEYLPSGGASQSPSQPSPEAPTSYQPPVATQPPVAPPAAAQAPATAIPPYPATPPPGAPSAARAPSPSPDGLPF